MTADVFASLQALPNTQTLQTPAQQTPSDGADIQPGIFAALMNECIAEGETAENPVQMFVIPEEVSELQNSSQTQMMAFTGNNSFPQSVMNILAGESESDEVVPIPENEMPSPEIADDDSDKVIWPEDETAIKSEDMSAKAEKLTERIIARVKSLVQEKPQGAELTDSDIQEIAEQVIAEDGIDDLPEELRQEIAQAVNDVAAELKHEDGSGTQPFVKLRTANSQTVAPKTLGAIVSAEDDSEAEQTPDVEVPDSQLAGLAGIVNTHPQPAEHPETQDTGTQPEHSAITSQPTRQRRVQPETQQVPHEHQQTPESQEVRADSREVFVNRNADPENSGQDSQQEPQSQNQSQSQNQPQTQNRKTESRNPKTESVSQKQDTEIRRTESHSDFGAYFEGVLNSRRSTARVSAPMPLNLRTAENFNQASALRDGITNVVRFIRADGVQKARVVVDPPALGRVSVELTSGTSGVEASIKVASEQIRQLVQDQISQLRMNLSQQGVQVAEFTVDVQQDSSGNHNQQGQEQYAGRFGFVDDSDEDEAEDFRIDLNEGLLYWVA